MIIIKSNCKKEYEISNILKITKDINFSQHFRWKKIDFKSN